MKTVLLLAALVEGATGGLLLTFPSIVLRMLFGAEVTGAGEVTGRIAGIALIGLAAACWPDGSTRSALRGMLTYSLLALLFLVYLGVRGGLGRRVAVAGGRCPRDPYRTAPARTIHGRGRTCRRPG